MKSVRDIFARDIFKIPEKIFEKLCDIEKVPVTNMKNQMSLALLMSRGYKYCSGNLGPICGGNNKNERDNQNIGGLYPRYGGNNQNIVGRYPPGIHSFWDWITVNITPNSGITYVIFTRQ